MLSHNFFILIVAICSLPLYASHFFKNTSFDRSHKANVSHTKKLLKQVWNLVLRKSELAELIPLFTHLTRQAYCHHYPIPTRYNTILIHKLNWDPDDEVTVQAVLETFELTSPNNIFKSEIRLKNEKN